jgi:predicted 3-demethylubiquinone-9 3-methyltransferase (glyoxalase superfamily)
MQKITPFLWFDNNAEEAMTFYISVFKEAKVLTVTRYDDAGNGVAGKVMTAVFQLFGQNFIALNGGPQFEFNESVSFVVNCTSQEEVDYYWENLSMGGRPSRCGWLKDRFGLSWQIVPAVLGKLMQTNNPEKAKSVMAAMMQMNKMDIQKLQEAYDQA